MGGGYKTGELEFLNALSRTKITAALYHLIT